MLLVTLTLIITQLARKWHRLQLRRTLHSMVSPTRPCRAVRFITLSVVKHLCGAVSVGS
jgi:hypothetical protein